MNGLFILIAILALLVVWIGFHEELADIDAEEERRLKELERRFRNK